MKTRRVVFGLVALIGLGIAFGVIRHFRVYTTLTIKISTLPSGTCKADPPTLDLSSQHNKVQWLSKDQKQYFVSFAAANVLVPPGSLPGYTPDNPLAPPDEPVNVDPTNGSKQFNLKQKYQKYYYAILDQNNNICRYSTDESDTSLNVKP